MTLTEMLVLYLTVMLTGFSVYQIFDNKGNYDNKHKAVCMGFIIFISIFCAIVVHWIVNYREALL